MMLTFVKVKYERFQFINDFRTVSMLVMFEFHLKSLELGNRSIYGLELISSAELLCWLPYHWKTIMLYKRVMVYNATFNNISVIS